MITHTIDHCPLILFPSRTEHAPLVLVHTVGDEAPALYDALCSIATVPFHLACLAPHHWNDDLSPWPAQVELGEENAFSGHALDQLAFLEERLLPFLAGALPAYGGIILAGYSMAGLFALYAPYKSIAFDKIVSCSGSLWYPDFADYVCSHAFAKAPKSIYLSLGDREGRTRHPLMSQVNAKTEAIYTHYQALGLPIIFEWNAGCHFKNPVARLARGIAWSLRH